MNEYKLRYGVVVRNPLDKCSFCLKDICLIPIINQNGHIIASICDNCKRENEIEHFNVSFVNRNYIFKCELCQHFVPISEYSIGNALTIELCISCALSNMIIRDHKLFLKIINHKLLSHYGWCD